MTTQLQEDIVRRFGVTHAVAEKMIKKHDAQSKLKASVLTAVRRPVRAADETNFEEDPAAWRAEVQRRMQAIEIMEEGTKELKDTMKLLKRVMEAEQKLVATKTGSVNKKDDDWWDMQHSGWAMGGREMFAQKLFNILRGLDEAKLAAYIMDKIGFQRSIPIDEDDIAPLVPMDLAPDQMMPGEVQEEEELPEEEVPEDAEGIEAMLVRGAKHVLAAKPAQGVHKVRFTLSGGRSSGWARDLAGMLKSEGGFGSWKTLKAKSSGSTIDMEVEPSSKRAYAGDLPGELIEAIQETFEDYEVEDTEFGQEAVMPSAISGLDESDIKVTKVKTKKAPAEPEPRKSGFKIKKKGGGERRIGVAAPANKNKVKKYMQKKVGDFLDRRTGEVNTTKLAEDAADEFNNDGWLDDETHWVWDLAIDVGEWFEMRASASAPAIAGQPTEREWKKAKHIATDPATQAKYWDIGGTTWRTGGPGSRPGAQDKGPTDQFITDIKAGGKYAKRIKLVASKQTTADVKADIEKWIKNATKHIEKITTEKEPEKAFMKRTLGFTKGKKYYRVYIERADESGADRSAYCFIDMEGNIYKADSWKRPAKGIRGTVHTVDPNKIDQYTSWLYRR